MAGGLTKRKCNELQHVVRNEKNISEAAKKRTNPWKEYKSLFWRYSVANIVLDMA